MPHIKIVEVPKWRLFITRVFIPHLKRAMDDVSHIFECKTKDIKLLIGIVIILYCITFLLMGFAWAIVDYKLIGV